MSQCQVSHGRIAEVLQQRYIEPTGGVKQFMHWCGELAPDRLRVDWEDAHFRGLMDPASLVGS